MTTESASTRYHPIDSLGSGIVYARPLGNDPFYPGRYLYLEELREKRIRRTARFRKLFKYRLKKVERIRSARITRYVVQRSARLNDTLHLLTTTEGTDPGHIILLLDEQLNELQTVFSLTEANYIRINKKLWMKVLWLPDEKAWLLDGARAKDVNPKCPIGTFIFVRH